MRPIQSVYNVKQIITKNLLHNVKEALLQIVRNKNKKIRVKNVRMDIIYKVINV